MTDINLWAGWTGILVGFLTGAGLGMFFHNEDWLGGYQSWERRMLRLGHIACMMLGLINILYFFTAKYMALPTGIQIFSSHFFVLGLISMPLCCWGSAWKKPLRHLFFIPVLSLVLAAGALLWGALH